ncbi:phosphate transport system substrate-binding protein, partial [Nitrosomonas halophila]
IFSEIGRGAPLSPAMVLQKALSVTHKFCRGASIGTVAHAISQGIAIKLLPLDRIVASAANVREGSYPLARPLNLVTRETPVGLVRDFIEFARSAQVHDLVEAQYFVPASLR